MFCQGPEDAPRVGPTGTATRERSSAKLCRLTICWLDSAVQLNFLWIRYLLSMAAVAANDQQAPHCSRGAGQQRLHISDPCSAHALPALCSLCLYSLSEAWWCANGKHRALTCKFGGFHSEHRFLTTSKTILNLSQAQLPAGHGTHPSLGLHGRHLALLHPVHVLGWRRRRCCAIQQFAAALLLGSGGLG